MFILSHWKIWGWLAFECLTLQEKHRNNMSAVCLHKTCSEKDMFWFSYVLAIPQTRTRMVAKKNLTYPLKFCRHDTVGFLRQVLTVFCMIITTKARNWALFRPEMSFPIWSMYSIFTYIWVIFRVNGGKYTIHGAFGFHYTGWFIGIPSWPLLMLPNIKHSLDSITPTIIYHIHQQSCVNYIHMW